MQHSLSICRLVITKLSCRMIVLLGPYFVMSSVVMPNCDLSSTVPIASYSDSAIEVPLLLAQGVSKRSEEKENDKKRNERE